MRKNSRIIPLCKINFAYMHNHSSFSLLPLYLFSILIYFRFIFQTQICIHILGYGVFRKYDKVHLFHSTEFGMNSCSIDNNLFGVKIKQVIIWKYEQQMALVSYDSYHFLWEPITFRSKYFWIIFYGLHPFWFQHPIHACE